MQILGMGIAEILVILVIALIVFGPERLPEIALAAGRVLDNLRRASRELTADLQGSMAQVRTELDSVLGETQADLREAASTVQQEARSLSADLQDTATSIQRETRALSGEITARPAASTAASAAENEDAAADDPDTRWLQLGSATEDEGADAG